MLFYQPFKSLNFHPTFLQVNMIENVLCTVKTVFFLILLPGIVFKLPITGTPDNSNFFRFPLKVRVIGSQLYIIVELLIS